jgi:type II secretory pathway pseudopilin PulG
MSVRACRPCGWWDVGLRAGRAAPAGACSRRAFTLIETALATVIIGVGVLALVDSQVAFMASNAWSTQTATANYLAGEIRELTRRLPKHDPVDGLYVDKNNILRGWGPRAGDAGPQDFAYITAFDGLTFKDDGSAGWADGNLPGPIDAFGTVIPDVDSSGAIHTTASNAPVPLRGWSQEVHVVKVDPFNNSRTYANNAILPLDGVTGFKGLAVDQFPLRVTVIVKYRGSYSATDTEMAKVSWIVP